MRKVVVFCLLIILNQQINFNVLENHIYIYIYIYIFNFDI